MTVYTVAGQFRGDMQAFRLEPGITPLDLTDTVSSTSQLRAEIVWITGNTNFHIRVSPVNNGEATRDDLLIPAYCPFPVALRRSDNLSVIKAAGSEDGKLWISRATML